MKLNPITYAKLEDYEDYVLTHRDKAGQAYYKRMIVEAARSAGIAEDLPAEDDLTNAEPWQVLEWAAEIVEAVEAAKAPPEKN